MPINPNGGIILDTQTEIKLDSEPLSRKLIEKMIDSKTPDEIVELMTKGQKIDWVPLLAMLAYNASANLYLIKNTADWFKNCQIGQKRLNFIDYNTSHIIYKLTEKGFLTNCISKEWKGKKPGHEMYSIEYLTSNGTETQYYMQDGGDYRFKSLEDAENFLDLYQKILDIMIDGKKVKPCEEEILFVVEKVAKRKKIKR